MFLTSVGRSSFDPPLNLSDLKADIRAVQRLAESTMATQAGTTESIETTGTGETAAGSKSPSGGTGNPKSASGNQSSQARHCPRQAASSYKSRDRLYQNTVAQLLKKYEMSMEKSFRDRDGRHTNALSPTKEVLFKNTDRMLTRAIFILEEAVKNANGHVKTQTSHGEQKVEQSHYSIAQSRGRVIVFERAFEDILRLGNSVEECYGGCGTFYHKEWHVFEKEQSDGDDIVDAKKPNKKLDNKRESSEGCAEDKKPVIDGTGSLMILERGESCEEKREDPFASIFATSDTPYSFYNPYDVVGTIKPYDTAETISNPYFAVETTNPYESAPSINPYDTNFIAGISQGSCDSRTLAMEVKEVKNSMSKEKGGMGNEADGSKTSSKEAKEKPSKKVSNATDATIKTAKSDGTGKGSDKEGDIAIEEKKQVDEDAKASEEVAAADLAKINENVLSPSVDDWYMPENSNRPRLDANEPFPELRTGKFNTPRKLRQIVPRYCLRPNRCCYPRCDCEKNEGDLDVVEIEDLGRLIKGSKGEHITHVDEHESPQRRAKRANATCRNVKYCRFPDCRCTRD